MWLVAIRPSDSVARPRDRRTVVGVGLKGGLAGCRHELRRRHRRRGGRSGVARRAVFGRFPTAVLPTLGFLSRSKVRPATSTQVVPVDRASVATKLEGGGGGPRPFKVLAELMQALSRPARGHRSICTHHHMITGLAECCMCAHPGGGEADSCQYSSITSHFSTGEKKPADR